MILKILFYLFSIVLIYAAIRVISAKRPVTAVMHLVLAFVATSGLWILIQAEFLALTLVIIYVGAVLVLFLFVVMMLDINIDIVREGFTQYLPFGLLVALVIVLELLLILANKNGLFAAEQFQIVHNTSAEYSNTRELGMLLYQNFLYPFEIAAVILLVAMIAAIALVQRPIRSNNRSIAVSDQLKTCKSEQLRMVDIKSAVMEAPPVAEINIDDNTDGRDTK